MSNCNRLSIDRHVRGHDICTFSPFFLGPRLVSRTGTFKPSKLTTPAAAAATIDFLLCVFFPAHAALRGTAAAMTFFLGSCQLVFFSWRNYSASYQLAPSGTAARGVISPSRILMLPGGVHLRAQKHQLTILYRIRCQIHIADLMRCHGTRERKYERRAMQQHLDLELFCKFTQNWSTNSGHELLIRMRST